MDILNSPEPKLQEFMLSVGSFGDVTVGDGVNFLVRFTGSYSSKLGSKHPWLQKIRVDSFSKGV